MLHNFRLFSFFMVIAFFVACSAPVAENVNTTQTENSNEAPAVEEKPALPDGWDDIGNIVGSAKDYWAGKTPHNARMFYFDNKGINNIWQWRVRIIPMSSSVQAATLYAVNGGNSGVVNSTWKGRFFPLGADGKPDADESKGYDLTVKFLSQKEAEATFTPMASNKSGVNNLGTFKIYSL